MSARPNVTVVERELAAWRTSSAGELRDWATLMAAKAERAREVADLLDPPRRRKRRRRRKTVPDLPDDRHDPTPATEQVAQIGKSLAAVREGARRAGVELRGS